MVQSNAERQSGYRDRLKRAAYETDVMREQIAALATALNEARAALGLGEVQLPKSVGQPGRE